MKFYGIFLGLISSMCHAEYFLLPDCYEGKIAVAYAADTYNKPHYSREYFSFDRALAFGLYESHEDILCGTIEKIKKQQGLFVVEHVLEACGHCINLYKLRRIKASMLTCAVAGCAAACAGCISAAVHYPSTGKVIEMMTGLGIGSFYGALVCLDNYPSRKASAHDMFEKLITIDPALFVIKDNDLAVTQWNSIKESIGDQQLITKVEHFLHLT